MFRQKLSLNYLPVAPFAAHFRSLNLVAFPSISSCPGAYKRSTLSKAQAPKPSRKMEPVRKQRLPVAAGAANDAPEERYRYHVDLSGCPC